MSSVTSHFLHGSHSDTPDSERAANADFLRLAAIAVIFVVSFCAAGFPAAAKRIESIRIPNLVFYVGKHFGTGVILSTAFIHLLSDAFANLHGLRLASYSNWAGTIVLGSLLLIFLIEYTSTVYVESMASKDPTLDEEDSIHDEPSGEEHHHHHQHHHHPNGDTCDSPASERSRSHQGELARFRRLSESAPLLPRRGSVKDAYFDLYVHHQDHGHTSGQCDIKESRDKVVQLLGVLVLQLGIMMHSFVVGMTLAVTSATQFASLFTAILFHQLFEGLSLGVRLSTLPSSLPSLTPGSRGRSITYVPPLLTFLFGIITPIGIAVGLLIKHLVRSDAIDKNLNASPTPGGSTFRGVMSAVSAGLLIYAGCVELLAADFVLDVDMRKSSRWRQTIAVISLLSGAFAMAMIK